MLSDPAPTGRAAGPRERATVPIGGYGDEAGRGGGLRLPRGKALAFGAAGLALIAAMVVLVLALVDSGGGVHVSKPIPIGGAPLRIAADARRSGSPASPTAH